MSVINGLGRLSTSLPASIGKAAKSIPKTAPTLPTRSMGALGGLKSMAGAASNPTSSILNRIGSAKLPSAFGTAPALGSLGSDALSGAGLSNKSGLGSKILNALPALGTLASGASGLLNMGSMAATGAEQIAQTMEANQIQQEMAHVQEIAAIEKNGSQAALQILQG